MSNQTNPELTVVIPVYNERENIAPLAEELTHVLNGLGRAWEVICIDDGSQDGSGQALREIHDRDTRWRVLQFPRNFGKTAAYAAGFAAARGGITITMDADLQNDPADIQKLLAKLDEGFDAVSGRRERRQEPFLVRRLPSRLANSLIAWTTGVHIHDYGCALKAYRSWTLKSVRLYGEMHRFVPAIVSSVGARVTEVPVNDRKRHAGVSKFSGLDRTYKVLLDLIMVLFFMRFQTRPLRFFGGLGMLMGLTGFGICTYLSILRLVWHEHIGTRPLLMLGVLLILVAVQLVCTGLVAEYVMRAYYEGQGKEIFMASEYGGAADRGTPAP